MAGRGQQRASHAGKSKEDPSSGFHDFARSLGIPEAAPDTQAQRSAEHAPGPSAPGTRVPTSLSWSAGRPEPAWEWMPVPSTSVPGPQGSKAGEQARAPGEQLPSKPRAAGSEGTPAAKNEEVSHCQSPEARGSSWGLRKGGRRASPTGPGPALLRTHGPARVTLSGRRLGPNTDFPGSMSCERVQEDLSRTVSPPPLSEPHFKFG